MSTITREPLVDMFLIVGVEDDLSWDAKGGSINVDILSQFPEAKPVGFNIDLGMVSKFCFPSGVNFCIHPCIPDPIFHTFVMTSDDGYSIFCACLTFWESISIPQIASLDVLPGFPADRRPGKEEIGVDPFVPLPDGFTMYIPKCICLLSQFGFIIAYEEWLRQLYSLFLSRNTASLDEKRRLHELDVDSGKRKKQPFIERGVSLERYVHNLVMEVFLPSPGKTISFACTGDIFLHRPSEDDMPLLDFPITSLLGMLSIENTLMLFQALLLEERIVFMSTDTSALTAAAEVATKLLLPFYWRHVYVPVLSSSLLHSLEAPMPYIMGVKREWVIGERAEGFELPEGVVVVDLDMDSVSLLDASYVSHGQLLELPSPEADVLREKLTEYMDEYYAHDVEANMLGSLSDVSSFSDSAVSGVSTTRSSHKRMGSSSSMRELLLDQIRRRVGGDENTAKRVLDRVQNNQFLQVENLQIQRRDTTPIQGIWQKDELEGVAVDPLGAVASIGTISLYDEGMMENRKGSLVTVSVIKPEKNKEVDSTACTDADDRRRCMRADERDELLEIAHHHASIEPMRLRTMSARKRAEMAQEVLENIHQIELHGGYSSDEEDTKDRAWAEIESERQRQEDEAKEKYISVMEVRAESKYVRSFFIEFFATLLQEFQHFVVPTGIKSEVVGSNEYGSRDSSAIQYFQKEEFIGEQSHDLARSSFLTAVLNTQAFYCFVENYVKNPNEPELRFFTSVIRDGIDKLNSLSQTIEPFNRRNLDKNGSLSVLPATEVLEKPLESKRVSSKDSLPIFPVDHLSLDPERIASAVGRVPRLASFVASVQLSRQRRRSSFKMNERPASSLDDEHSDLKTRGTQAAELATAFHSVTKSLILTCVEESENTDKVERAAKLGKTAEREVKKTGMQSSTSKIALDASIEAARDVPTAAQKAVVAGTKKRLVSRLCVLIEDAWNHGLVTTNTHCGHPGAFWAFIEHVWQKRKARGHNLPYGNSSFITQTQIITNMRNLKTNTARGRAWVRLCLEKNSLYAHLEELFESEMSYLISCYDKDAFLRIEEHRLSLLVHLVGVMGLKCLTPFYDQYRHNGGGFASAKQTLFVSSNSSLSLSSDGGLNDANGNSQDSPSRRGKVMTWIRSKKAQYNAAVDERASTASINSEPTTPSDMTPSVLGRFFKRGRSDSGSSPKLPRSCSVPGNVNYLRRESEPLLSDHACDEDIDNIGSEDAAAALAYCATETKSSVSRRSFR